MEAVAVDHEANDSTAASAAPITPVHSSAIQSAPTACTDSNVTRGLGADMELQSW